MQAGRAVAGGRANSDASPCLCLPQAHFRLKGQQGQRAQGSVKKQSFVERSRCFPRVALPLAHTRARFGLLGYQCHVPMGLLPATPCDGRRFLRVDGRWLYVDGEQDWDEDEKKA